MALISGDSKVGIISKAFLLLGKPEPINDLNESVTTQGASQIYDMLLLSLLTVHDWRFSGATTQLNKETEKPLDTRWQFQFAYPTDPAILKPIRVFHQGSRLSIQNFEILGESILINHDDVLLMSYTTVKDPKNFPPYFVTAFVAELAAWLAIPVAQSLQLAQLWTTKADRQFRTARRLDSQIQPNPFVEANDIFSAHFAL